MGAVPERNLPPQGICGEEPAAERNLPRQGCFGEGSAAEGLLRKEGKPPREMEILSEGYPFPGRFL